MIIILFYIIIIIILGDESRWPPRFGNKNSTRTRDTGGGRKMVRSYSVPTQHVSSLPQQGLETPGGYSFSQNDAVAATEYRTPQSTRCGEKIAGVGGMY